MNNEVLGDLPFSGGHEGGMQAGRGRGRARHKDEVVPPEEHLHTADDRPTTFDRWRSLTLLMGYKPKQGCTYYYTMYNVHIHIYTMYMYK